MKRGAARRFLAGWMVAALSLTYPLNALCADAASSDAALNTQAMALQTRIFGKAPTNQTLAVRVAELEKYLLGKPQDGDLQKRLALLKDMLDGKARASMSKASMPDEIAQTSSNAVPEEVSKPFVPGADGDESGHSDGSGMLKHSTAVPHVVAEKVSLNPAPAPIASESQSQSQTPREDEAKNANKEYQPGSGMQWVPDSAALKQASLDASSQVGTTVPSLEKLPAGPSPGSVAVASPDSAATSTAPSLASALPSRLPRSDSSGTASGATINLSAAPSRRLHGRVDTLASNYALAGITLKQNNLPTEIMVKPNSRAIRAGVFDNDRLLHAELGIDTLALAIQRGGHRFMVEVPLTDNPTRLSAAATANAPLRSGAIANDNALKLGTGVNSKSSNVKLAAGTTLLTLPTNLRGNINEEWKVLKQFNICVLLDVSGSMGGMDQLAGMKKADWCRGQISSFAQEVERLGNGTFDFGTFTSDFSIMPNCNASMAVAQLDNNPPHGGTNIARALQAAVDLRASKPMNKPYLIVVITDGMSAGEPIDALLVQTAQTARVSGDIRVIFLQIGRGPGQDLVDYLDTQLMSDGAPYDIVSSIDWNQLSQMTLRSGLTAAISKPLGAEAIDPQRQMAFDRLKERFANSRANIEMQGGLQNLNNNEYFKDPSGAIYGGRSRFNGMNNFGPPGSMYGNGFGGPVGVPPRGNPMDMMNSYGRGYGGASGVRTYP